MVCGQFRIKNEMLRFCLGGTGSARVAHLLQGPPGPTRRSRTLAEPVPPNRNIPK